MSDWFLALAWYWEVPVVGVVIFLALAVYGMIGGVIEGIYLRFFKPNLLKNNFYMEDTLERWIFRLVWPLIIFGWSVEFMFGRALKFVFWTLPELCRKKITGPAEGV